MIITSGTQLKDMIKNLARKHSADSQILLRTYMTERFLERLSQSSYKNNFIIKGGMLITAMVGIQSRSTMDLDTTIKGFTLNQDELESIINQICLININDGVTFEIKSFSEIMDEADYPGVRISMNCFYDNIRIPMKLDISTGDVITPKEIAFKYQLMFEKREIALLAYNIETVLDDIVGRFINFVKVVYGESDLEDNLQFIADTLGGNGSARDVIRNYFTNGFYADHCKTYQKRPIYWLFDSGKKNGFKCLVYMHRYQKDTIARIRTDYLHEQQARYRTAIADLQAQIAEAATSTRVRLQKQLKKLQEQADEALAYEEKIHHMADQMIGIDLDDGVKHNYEIFKDVLAKIK